MSSAQYPLRQSGIYHSRPTLDPSIENLTAIVCSATSISRFQAIRALLDTADCWSKIYALSCSPSFKEMLACFTDQQLARIQHVSIDLRSSAAEIAHAFRAAQVTASYIFYYAYFPPSTSKSAMDSSTAADFFDANIPPL
jgi:hypothetical protein